jgi:hypothetical protein
MIAVTMDEVPQRAMRADKIIELESDVQVTDRVWVKRLHCEGVVQEVRWDEDGEVEYYLVRVGGEGAGALALLVDPLDVGTWL